MLPTTWVPMKSRAQFDITTYSRYQARNATVAGNTKLRNRRRSSWNCSVW